VGKKEKKQNRKEEAKTEVLEGNGETRGKRT